MLEDHYKFDTRWSSKIKFNGDIVCCVLVYFAFDCKKIDLRLVGNDEVNFSLLLERPGTAATSVECC